MDLINKNHTAFIILNIEVYKLELSLLWCESIYNIKAMCY